MSRNPDAEGEESGVLSGLDRLLDQRVRLAACVLLSRADALTFSRLKELLGGTDGNLGAHLRRLEEAGYVEVRKEFQQRRPVSWYRLTSHGREALEAHVSGLRDLLSQARADDGNGATGSGGRKPRPSKP